MKALYLIGNGFDIANGLNTSVESYYKFLNNVVSDKGLEKYQKSINILLKDKEENPESWSDYELGLGAVAQRFSSLSEYTKFVEDLYFVFYDFIKSKNTYSLENKNNDDWYHCSAKILTFLASGLQLADEKQITGFVRANINEVNFVTFNYTHLLTECIEVLNKNITPTLNNHEVFLHSPFHIHGLLDDKNGLQVGVDNIKQILNEKFRNNDVVAKRLIKQQSNELLRLDKLQQFNSLLNSSSLVCIFGLSLGETDATYWKEVGKWVANQNASNRYLVISYFNEEVLTPAPWNVYEPIDNYLNLFFKRAELNEQQIEIAKQRVFISANPNMTLFEDEAK